MRKTSPVIRSNTPSIRSPLLSKKPVSSTSTSTSTTRLLSSTSLPSYYHNSILYSLNQQVQCNLHNGVFEGTIKYIGSPIMDKKDVYFGILFTKNTGSQFNGIINVFSFFSILLSYRILVCLIVSLVMVLFYFLLMLLSRMNLCHQIIKQQNIIYHLLLYLNLLLFKHLLLLLLIFHDQLQFLLN